MNNFYIKGLQTGDEQIFKELFECFHARLCYFACSLLNGTKETEDVVQDAFVRLWQRKENFDNLQSVKAFLYLTVKNACLNIHKHEKVVCNHREAIGKLYVEDADDPDMVTRIIEAETLDKVYQALQKLPKGCRTVLNLSYFEEMKNEDISTHLQVSINTIKTQKKRALHLLRTMLKVSSIWLLILLGYIS